MSNVKVYAAPVNSIVAEIPYVRLAQNAYFDARDIEHLKPADIAAVFGVGEDALQGVVGLFGEQIVCINKVKRFPQGRHRTSEGIKIDGGALTLHSGVTALAASSDVGKTPLAQYMAEYVAKKTNAGIVFWGEPFAGFLTEYEELALLVLAAVRENDFVVVDSLKNMARSAGGTTMGDGLSSAFFELLSDWSAHFASYNKYIITPVNFSTGKADAIKSALESIRSNSTGIVYTEEGSESWNWKSRPGVGAKRNTGSFRIHWAEKGVGKLSSTTATRVDDEEDLHYDIGAYAAKSMDALSRATRKSIRNFN